MGTTQAITMYTDSRGFPFVSLTESMLAWRKSIGALKFKTAEPNIVDGVCQDCNGDELVRESRLGILRCLCAVKKEEAFMRSNWNAARTMHDAKSIGPYNKKTGDGFDIWGDSQSQKSLAQMLDVAKEFSDYPSKWLTIGGNPGTGKSHVLQYLADMYGPWAVYIDDTEFESKIFSAYDDGSKTLNQLLEIFKRAPILLYDDLGAGHNSPFPVDMLQKIISFRYNMHKEYLTVVTTNLSEPDLIRLSPRIADRIRDTKVVNFIPLKGVKSWRTQRDN